MKKTIALILIVLTPILTQAKTSMEKITCRNSNDFSHIQFDIKRHDNGYARIQHASLIHNYASAPNLSCMGYIMKNSYDVDCVGFYVLDKEVTQLKLLNEGNQIVALWKTSEPYANLEMRSVCTLLKVN